MTFGIIENTKKKTLEKFQQRISLNFCFAQSQKPKKFHLRFQLQVKTS